MTISRYSRAPILKLGEQYGTSDAIVVIRNAVKNGTIRTREVIVRGAERLDTLAGSLLGDGRLWWVLASTSGIGWSLQCPPGTILLVPDIQDIANLVG